MIINQPKIFVGAPSSNFEISRNLNSSQADINEGISKKITRNASSNGSKKKMRLRKMGSRQNSKTESDSTSDEDATNIILETPRRVKRKTSRTKRVQEEERKGEEKKEDQYGGEDIVYVLKIKPGQVIEQTEKQGDTTDSKVLISPTESCVQLMEASQENLTNSASAFVKTKRKIFTAINEPIGDGKTVIVRDLESTSSASDGNERESSESEKSKSPLKALPPVPQSPSSQGKLEEKTLPPKELSLSIRLMIDKYNQKIANDVSPKLQTDSPIMELKSPKFERRVQEQKIKYEIENVVKCASAGNIRQNEKLIPVEISLKDYDNNKLQKSCSAGILPRKWEPVPIITRNSPENEKCIPSLACDSLQMITKNCSTTSEFINPFEKKEHLYRKNKEKPTSLFSKTGAVRKIGTKNARSEFIWRRSLSNSCNTSTTPDKSDNTIPKITRKLETKGSFDINNGFNKKYSRPSVSAPTTPSEEIGRPKTPLSERALKLQKAKEEFLNAKPFELRYSEGLKENKTYSSNKDSINDDDDDENPWKKRLSQVSIGSDTSNEECILAKSASVGLIETVTNDNQHLGGYVSLPRNVSRSGKIISKFGFSTLASKFRKVKMRRTSKDNTTKMNAVSILCRQSLAIDIMPEENIRQELNRKQNIEDENSSMNLLKSGSSQAISFGTLFRNKDKDKLNKSKSTGSVLNDDNFHK